LIEKATPLDAWTADLLAWVCSQTRLSVPNAQGMAASALGVCSLGPAALPCSTKIRTDYFLPNYSLNAKCITMKRQPHLLPIVFSTLCGKDNSVITLFQSTMPFVYVNCNMGTYLF